MNIYEHSARVNVAPEELFAFLADVRVLTDIMPRSAALADGTSEAWLRVDEPGCTLTWGSDQHFPGSLDVLPTSDPDASTLVVRVYADRDVTAQLIVGTAAITARLQEAAVQAA